eukprot:gnl/TRDRNA2_/TRDRNA2_177912_c0_seq1.p1 gnl/TRDRNA2_/TRDRNA2_177912_c0~~gnl/TRDRNA2_/TRDRNA2_177912_c0_seq1.p1  ORF type:complete len:455 (-),score=-40.57 gnl/TRDRNA2_/TRDRNA2_177912_c0_seq1:1357-2721(-)
MSRQKKFSNLYEITATFEKSLNPFFFRERKKGLIKKKHQHEYFLQKQNIKNSSQKTNILMRVLNYKEHFTQRYQDSILNMCDRFHEFLNHFFISRTPNILLKSHIIYQTNLSNQNSSKRYEVIGFMRFTQFIIEFLSHRSKVKERRFDSEVVIGLPHKLAIKLLYDIICEDLGTKFIILLKKIWINYENISKNKMINDLQLEQIFCALHKELLFGLTSTIKYTAPLKEKVILKIQSNLFIAGENNIFFFFNRLINSSLNLEKPSYFVFSLVELIHITFKAFNRNIETLVKSRKFFLTTLLDNNFLSLYIRLLKYLKQNPIYVNHSIIFALGQLCGKSTQKLLRLVNKFSNLHIIKTILTDTYIDRDNCYYDALSLCIKVEKSLIKTIMVHYVPVMTTSIERETINYFEIIRFSHVDKLKEFEIIRSRMYQNYARLKFMELLIETGIHDDFTLFA